MNIGLEPMASILFVNLSLLYFTQITIGLHQSTVPNEVLTRPKICEAPAYTIHATIFIKRITVPTHIFTLSFHAKPWRVLVQSQLVLSLFVARPTKSLFRRLSRKHVALLSASRLQGFVGSFKHRSGLLTTPFCLLEPSIIPPQHGSAYKAIRKRLELDSRVLYGSAPFTSRLLQLYHRTGDM